MTILDDILTHNTSFVARREYEAFLTDRFPDKKLVVRSVAHLYLLPATEARSLATATVVLSWDADPGTLHLHYSEQERAGLQLIFVSRIASRIASAARSNCCEVMTHRIKCLINVFGTAAFTL